MAYEILTGTKSLKATSSLATSQFCFVKLDTSAQIVLAGNGNAAIGVVQDKPAANDPGLVCGPGSITKVQCGGSISAGQQVQSDGSGKAVAAVTGSYVLGWALEAGANNGIATILFQPLGAKLA